VALTGLHRTSLLAGLAERKISGLSAFYISILDSNFTIFGPHFRPQITKYGKYGNAEPKSVMHYAK